MDKLISALINIVSLKQRLHPFYVFCVLIAVSIFYIFSPLLPFGTPAVQIQGPRLLVELPSNFTQLNINFREPTYMQGYYIRPQLVRIPGQRIVRQPEAFKKEMNEKLLSIEVSMQASPSALKGTQISSYRIDFTLREQYPFAELVTVELDGRKIDLKRFYDENIKTQATRFISTNSIRSDLSRLLVKVNEPISNFVLTILVATVLLLTFHLVRIAAYVYLYPMPLFKKRVMRMYAVSTPVEGEELANAKHKCGINFTRKDSFYRFLQTLGPAVGFIITVSSLVVALHPAIQQSQDIAKFFSAIQIAMISTFVGLFVRFISLLIQASNRQLLAKEDDVFTSLELELAVRE